MTNVWRHLQSVENRMHLPMKTIEVRSKFLAMALVGLLAPSAINVVQGRASLTHVQGGVSGGVAGDMLGVGSIVSTSAGSQAVLDIYGDTVVLAENSTLSLDLLEFDDTGIERILDVQMNLSTGRIYGRVSRFGALSKFIVGIPKGQVAIDATDGPVIFDISADGRVLIGEGSVDVMFNRGTSDAPNMVTQRVVPNQSFNPITGDVSPEPGGGIAEIIDTAQVRVPPTPPRPVEPLDDSFRVFVSPRLGVKPEVKD